MLKIGIIGSGIAAISVAKKLVKRGLKPIIIDKGDTLNQQKKDTIKKLKNLDYTLWSKSDLKKLYKKDFFFNPLIKKSVFGSNFFYGKSISQSKISKLSSIPFFSYARGGLAEGWAAAVLPPDDNDIQDWPISNIDLKKSFNEVLAELPLSMMKDDLIDIFPSYKDDLSSLNQSPDTSLILDKFLNIKNRENFIIGNSRLLTRTVSDGEYLNCQYCGRCMQGCVYGSIYRPSQDLDKLIKKKLVNYQNNLIVQRLVMEKNKIKVEFFNSALKKNEHFIFDKIFLATGAIGSSRIMMQSNNYFGNSLTLKTKSQIIFPLISKSRIDSDWPNVNTQPDIFLEYKNLNKKLYHWTHTQININNDLIANFVPFVSTNNVLAKFILKKIMSHLLIAHTTLHSNYSDHYQLKLIKKNEDDLLKINFVKKLSSQQFLNIAQNDLVNLFKYADLAVLKYFIFKKTYSTHLGCSLPMKKKPSEKFDTDIMGVPNDWKNVHIVDTSIFPSLPGTPIGLLLAANANRIASQVKLN